MLSACAARRHPLTLFFFRSCGSLSLRTGLQTVCGRAKCGCRWPRWRHFLSGAAAGTCYDFPPTASRGTRHSPPGTTPFRGWRAAKGCHLGVLLGRTGHARCGTGRVAGRGYRHSVCNKLPATRLSRIYPGDTLFRVTLSPSFVPLYAAGCALLDAALFMALRLARHGRRRRSRSPHTTACARWRTAARSLLQRRPLLSATAPPAHLPRWRRANFLRNMNCNTYAAFLFLAHGIGVQNAPGAGSASPSPASFSTCSAVAVRRALRAAWQPTTPVYTPGGRKNAHRVSVAAAGVADTAGMAPSFSERSRATRRFGWKRFV